MAIRKKEELAIEILLVRDDESFYLKIERYVTFFAIKESISNQIAFVRITESAAEEIITNLKLVAVEREDKTAINYRGKAWFKQQEYRKPKTNC